MEPDMTPDEMMQNLFGTLLKQYWWFLLFILLWPVLKSLIPTLKGKIGEGVVNLAAKLRLDPNIYHLLKDVTIPSKRGTTQIDHVIVSKFGLFVIETKNYKGWIYASARDPKWTQVNFKQKHRFQNPLRQNYAHICALAELLNLPKEKIHGVVCFMGDAKFKNGVPEGVFLEGHYVNHIESFQTPVFSETEVENMIQKIETGRLARGIKTNRDHVRQLRRKRTETEDQKPEDIKEPSANHPSVNKACPACGSVMVLRTAKRGTNAGNQFWGCSRYPACRATTKP